MSTLLAIPTRGEVWHETASTVVHYAQSRQAAEVIFAHSKTSVVGARNEALAHFLRSKHKVMVMLDDDILPPPMACAGLASVVDNGYGAIAGAVCPVNRGHGIEPAVYKLNPDGDLYVPAKELKSSKDEIINVDAVGFGMVAISKLLAQMAGNFTEALAPDGSRERGEDLDYCLRAHNFGHQVVCVRTCICDHHVPIYLNRLLQDVHP